MNKPPHETRGQGDPFAGVEARSVTEIEREAHVKVQHVELPDAAKLTQLSIGWLLLAIVLCVGATVVGQFVEIKHLRQALASAGILEESNPAPASAPASLPATEPEAEKLLDDRAALRRRISDIRQRQRNLDRTTRPETAARPEPAPEPEAELPLTLEGLRVELRERAGADFDNYRRFGTVLALVIGALGLLLLALFVRALWAAIFGGAALGLTMLAGLSPWIVWGSALLAGAFGAWLGPRLLLAAIVSNATLAGLVIGGMAGGGSVYLATGSELFGLTAAGGGVALGGVLGFKFARPMFLAAVVANCAGFGAFVLWLLWGDLFTWFWPVTMGSLMLFDGLTTRLYHRFRWGE